ncbi:MAG: aminotransferase class IV [Flavitalea sp.]
MPRFVNFNGKQIDEDSPIVTAGNRGLRYGDGVFETMKMVDSDIRLAGFHFERLFGALNLLQFSVPSHFTADYLREKIIQLCSKNNLGKAVRIRLNVFRRNGGLYDLIDHSPEFVIEAWELPDNYLRLNENGLIVDVFDGARKSPDRFSNIKSNNYLPYTMGAFFAKQQKLNDCLILNTHERACDATIANIFWVKNQTIFTPPLSEGCIAGVMRRHLLEFLPAKGYQVQEQILNREDLYDADELFLTNATSEIRWVKEFREKRYQKNLSPDVYQLLS